MGASGSGKSTVGALLAASLSFAFVDGDALHSSANKAKMAAGQALNDADRRPWLDAVAAVLTDGDVIAACSALKRVYRDQLRTHLPELKFVYLAGSEAILAQRLAARTHAFMPATLLASQLATLEPPQADEAALTLSVELPVGEIVARAARWLGAASRGLHQRFD